jgi:thiol-disulfide isomerase/thioredoxin
MKKSIVITAIIFFLVSIGFGQIIYQDQKAPTLQFDEWVGKTASQDSLEGKAIVLEFWANWCKGCLQAVPHINSLSEKYQRDIIFISVNLGDSLAVVEKLIEKHNIQTLVAMDVEQTWKGRLKIRLVPATFLIDKKGMMRWRGSGFELTEDILDVFLEKDTILPITDTELINKKINFQKMESSPQQIDLMLERVVNEAYQQNISSLNFDFDSTYVLKLDHVAIPSLIRTLIGESAIEEEQPELIFEGIVPNHYEVNFSAKSAAPNAKNEISKRLLEELTTELKFRIDTLYEERDAIEVI